MLSKTAMLFATCLCACFAHRQGKEAVVEKNRIKSTNGLFVSQYHFLNSEDSFVHLSFCNCWKRVELTSPAVPYM